MVERAHRSGDCSLSTGVDAVILCVSINYPVSRKSPEVLLIKQFRPALDRYVIEFVAGLREQGESPEEAGLRELKEEVGYECVQIDSMHGPVSLEPGMSSSTASLLCLSVNGDRPENQASALHATPDENEKIIAYRIHLDDLETKLLDFEQAGCLVAISVSAFCIGLATTPKQEYSSMVEASLTPSTPSSETKKTLRPTSMLETTASIKPSFSSVGNADWGRCLRSSEAFAKLDEVEQRTYLFSFCNVMLPVITMVFGVALGVGAASLSGAVTVF